MTSKEALEIIIFRLTSHEEDLELRETDKKVIEIIKQDLERLEALKKENVELRQEVSALEDYSYDVDCEKEFLIKENEKLKKIIKENFWVFNNDEVLFKFNENIPVMQEEIKEVLENE